MLLSSEPFPRARAIGPCDRTHPFDIVEDILDLPLLRLELGPRIALNIVVSDEVFRVCFSDEASTREGPRKGRFIALPVRSQKGGLMYLGARLVVISRFLILLDAVVGLHFYFMCDLFE